MLESYITPLITSYISKYIKNIKPSDLQLSFWGGDAVLHNLELRLEAIEELLKGLVPFHLKSGCVKKLTIHIPWTAIGSEAIIVSLDSVECSMKLKNLRLQSSATSAEPQPHPNITPTPTDEQGQMPGYVQGLMNRIANNIIIRVQNVVVKVIEEECDMLMSFSVKSLEWCAVNKRWRPEFLYSDSLQGDYELRKVCLVSDMTVCLDQIGSGGQVETYEEPFVYRCSLECRWMARYQDGYLVENGIEILSDEVAFSVTEVQFTLFLHLLDWVLAMYYSYKKLKGRDDLVEEDEAERLERGTRERSSPPEQSKDEQTGIVQNKSPSPEEEQGWGSWMWSFVTPDYDEGMTTKPVKPVPALSLALLAKNIIVDFKMTHRRRFPVLFTTLKKPSSRVLRVEFVGCLARVNRVPSTTLLGVSVGIMSVNGWVGGVCPCKRVTEMTKKKRHVHQHFDESQVHIYSLGTPHSEVNTLPLLTNSFFDEDKGTSVDISPDATPTPKDWLQQRPEYAAVWFSYEYYDISPEREVEICDEVVKIGDQFIVMSPDVLHRVWFYIDGFLKSLEATPLFSKGMVVIGDPLAKTNLNISSSQTKVIFTSYSHIIVSSDHMMPGSGHMNFMSSQTTSKLPSIVASYKELEVKVAMAMYSGNATVETPQQLSVNVKTNQLRISGCGWLGRDITGLTGLNTGETGLDIPVLMLNIHKHTIGVMASDSSHLHVEATRLRLISTFGQCATLFVMYQSWIRNEKEYFYPSANTSTSDAVKLILTDLNIQIKQSANRNDINGILRQVHACLIAYPLNTHCDTIPLIHCPANTKSYIKEESLVAMETGHRHGDIKTEERAVEMHIVVMENDTTDLETSCIELKIAGMAFLIEPRLLRLTEEVLSGLMELSHTMRQVKTEGPLLTDINAAVLVDRPEPEGLASLDPLTPSLVTTPLSPVEDTGDRDKEEDDDNVQRKHFLSIIQEFNTDIRIDHFLFITMTTVSELKYPVYLQEDPPTPLSLLPTISQNSDLVLLALPAFAIRTTDTQLYPSFTAKLPGTSSWQASLNNATLYTVMSGTAKHLIHPLCVEVSVVPVGSSLVDGVTGYGVHVDINLLHVSLSKRKIKLVLDTLTTLHQSFSPLLKPDKTMDIPPILETPKQHTHPHSVLSSPHLSLTSYTLPLPPSESSLSMFSNNGTVPSLWLQCTLSKLTIDLISEKTSGQLDEILEHWFHEGSKLDNERNTEKDEIKEKELIFDSIKSSDVLFVFESEEISFSLDKQETGVNCRLNVSSLEGSRCVKVGSGNIQHIKNHMFSKVFSSRRTVLTPEILHKVETMPGSSFHPVIWGSGGVSLQSPLSSHSSFVILEVRSRTENHRAMEVKVHIQMFEAVMCLSLMDTVLEVVHGVVEITGDRKKMDKDNTKKEFQNHTHNWPHLDLKLDCCRCLFPSFSSSSSSPSSCGLLADIGGVTIKSDLNFSIPRFELNTSALRKLTIMAAEKRIPALPGYEIVMFNYQLLGISLVNKEVSLPKVDIFPVSTATGIRILFSPAVDWFPPLYHSTSSKVCATGHSLEIYFDSEVFLSFGTRQANCIVKLALDMKNIIDNLSFNNTQRNQDYMDVPVHEQSHDSLSHDSQSTVPYQILMTAKCITMVYVQEEPSEEFTKNSLKFLLFQPVVMVTKTHDSSTVELSLFNKEISYYNTESEGHENLLETCQSEQNESTLSSGLLTLKWKSNHLEKYYSLKMELSRSLQLSLTPHFILYLHEILDSMVQTILPLQRVSYLPNQGNDYLQSAGQPHITDPKEHTSYECQINTKQLVLEVKGNFKPISDPPQLDINKGSGCIVLSCDALSVVLPSKENAQATHNINTITAVINCTDLQISCTRSEYNSHVMNGHVISIMRPVCLKCSVLHHFPGSRYDCGHTIISMSCDIFELVVSQWILSTVNELFKIYLDTTTKITTTLKLHLTKMESHREVHEGKNENEDVRKLKMEEEVMDKEVAVFHDDLRRGAFSFHTDNIENPNFPSPGEVTFFTGDHKTSAFMMWHYQEPRLVTKIQVLPVPLGILSQEDSPTDLKVICELAYYDEMAGSFVTIATLHLSETSTALWELENEGTEEQRGNGMHHRIWSLAIVGLEWTEEVEDDELINRTDLPLKEIPTSSILSPLVLAGSACVDSSIISPLLPIVTTSLLIRKASISFMNQPTAVIHSNVYKGYTIREDLSHIPLNLFQIDSSDLKTLWKIQANRRQVVESKGELSLSFQDMKDLTWKLIIYPTHVQTNLIIEQKETSLKLSSNPCLIRLSPSLIHTATMATDLNQNMFNNECEMEMDGTICPGTHTTTNATVLAPYIICNDTMNDVCIGQESIMEWKVVFSKSCIGYSWKSHRVIPQVLRLNLMDDLKWIWSSPFSPDEDGVHEVMFPSANEEEDNIYIYVEVISIGGIQKQATIFGTWKITSSLSFPLSIAAHTSLQDSDPSQFRPDSHVSKSVILAPKGDLPSIIKHKNGKTSLKIMFQDKEHDHSTLQECLDVSLDELNNEKSQPHPLTIMIPGKEKVYFWFFVTPMFPLTEFKDIPLKITFAPIFEYINNLPCDLIVSAQINDTTESTDFANTFTISGHGECTSISNLSSNCWYLLKFTCVLDPMLNILSSPLPISTYVLDQLEPCDEEDCGIWPYNECLTHRSSSHQLDSKSLTLRSISVPSDCHGNSISVHLDTRRRPDGTISIFISPDVLLVNETMREVRVTFNDGRNLKLEENNRTAVCVDEEFVLSIQQEGIKLQSSLMSLKDFKMKDKKLKLKRVNLFQSSYEKITAELCLEISLHKTTLNAVVKPLYIVVNKTNYPVTILPLLSSTNGPVDPSDRLLDSRCLLKLEPSESMPLISWDRTLEVEKLTYVLHISADFSREKWSLPLSLNFVRYCFSLPVVSETSPSAEYVPCLVTTHKFDNCMYVVMDTDPFPRLLINNLCPDLLKIKEANTRDIYAHPQTLYPGSQISFEPPTLAALYPIIKELDEANEEDNRVRRLTDVGLQFQVVSHDSHVTSWSSPITLPLVGKLPAIYLEGYGSIDLETWSKERTLYLSIRNSQASTEVTSRPVECVDASPRLVPHTLLEEQLDKIPRLVPHALLEEQLDQGPRLVPHTLLEEQLDQSPRLVPHTLREEHLDQGTLVLAESPRPIPQVVNASKSILVEKKFSIDIEELVILLDIESNGFIEPVFRITADNIQCMIPSQDTLDLKVDLIQIDNVSEISNSAYDVIICPRVQHDPPTQLIKTDSQPLIILSVHRTSVADFHSFHDISLSLQPITIQLDDTLLLKLKHIAESYNPPPIFKSYIPLKNQLGGYTVASSILMEASRDRIPLFINRFTIGSTAIYLSAHLSQIVSISCDDSALSFSQVRLTHTYTNSQELIQSLAIHYTTGLLMQAGWVLGSLDLIGSPGLLLNTLHTGLYNFVSLPYEGLTRGPGFFLMGLGQGFTSLISSVSGGVLRSVTNFATSVAENMERLSLDPDHTSYQETLRQGQRSSHLGSSLFSGASSFGMSLMSAIAGVVDQPMQGIYRTEKQGVRGYTQGMLTGVGKGLLGVVTKPIGGAFQLVSQTGHGLLKTTGLVCRPNLKHVSVDAQCVKLNRRNSIPSMDKYCRSLQRQHNQHILIESDIHSGESLLGVHGNLKLPGGSIFNCFFLLTKTKLHVFDTQADILLQTFSIEEYTCIVDDLSGSLVSASQQKEGSYSSIEGSFESTTEHRSESVQKEEFDKTSKQVTGITIDQNNKRKIRQLSPTNELKLTEPMNIEQNGPQATKGRRDLVADIDEVYSASSRRGRTVLLVKLCQPDVIEKTHDDVDDNLYQNVQRFLNLSQNENNASISSENIEAKDSKSTTSSSQYQCVFNEEIAEHFKLIYYHRRERLLKPQFYFT